MSFADDYYWNIDFSQATATSKKPVLDMGSLCDDSQSVRDFLASDPDDPTSIWHEAEHIGGILRAISRLDEMTT